MQNSEISLVLVHEGFGKKKCKLKFHSLQYYFGYPYSMIGASFSRL
jgi:hypothetical protein